MLFGDHSLVIVFIGLEDVPSN